MAMGAELFEQYLNLTSFRESNDLQATTMIVVIGHWRQHHEEDFIVIHDASSNFARQREMWERITSIDVPEQMHPAGDGTFAPFPLRVTETRSTDSKDSFSVQFCDIVAGLSARHFYPSLNDNDRKFLDDLIEVGLDNITFNGIRPQLILKWSGKIGQCAKVYPTLTNGCDNDEATEFFRQV